MSEVKVNKISPRSGTTVTLGDSGDTFTIPSGATINNQGTATNFGATGAASWTTTVKTNSDSGFTATAGEGYFLNTTAGTISVNLPAGSAGAVVAFKDYAGTWNNNNVTLVQNGSDKIGGSAVNATLSAEGSAVTLVFIDSTQGWLVTDDGLQSSAATAEYIAATGGSVTCSGNFKIHTFTGPGTFCVSNVGNPAGSDAVEYIVVAGGGGAGSYGPSEPGAGGGGGAGGFRFASPSLAPETYPGKPLAAPAGLPVSVQGYPITIGAGGVGQTPATDNGASGNPSTFSTITSPGGGGTNNNGTPSCGIGKPGGSGGGAGGTGLTARCAGTGNTPVVSPPQGNDGGTYTGSGAPFYATAGGGGATAVGQSIPCHNTPTGGAGGAGAGVPPSSFGSNGESCGSFRYYAGGGAGSVYTSGGSGAAGGTGGVGGGGNGIVTGGTACSGTANTGGGGGGQGKTIGGTGGSGGSGIVVIRYKFQ